MVQSISYLHQDHVTDRTSRAPCVPASCAVRYHLVSQKESINCSLLFRGKWCMMNHFHFLKKPLAPASGIHSTNSLSIWRYDRIWVSSIVSVGEVGDSHSLVMQCKAVSNAICSMWWDLCCSGGGINLVFIRHQYNTSVLVNDWVTPVLSPNATRRDSAER